METGTITGKVLGASEKVSYLFDNLRFNANLFFLVDIILVAVILYWVYVFLKETKAMTILYGLIFILILAAIGKVLDLILLNWLLKSLMTALIVAIPVVFQPELRTALERLGRSRLIGELNLPKERTLKLIEDVISAVEHLSKTRTGALIVIKRQTGLKEYIDNGIPMNATVSSELLRSIFYPNSPLHDGAVIISGDKIISARSILPVSSAELNNDLGTRHKAGLGIAEDTDSISIIVSEEKGTISMAVNGKLEHKIEIERLKNRLMSYTRKK